jgi:DNA invertase Pin-like site-specific DNA recombinase
MNNPAAIYARVSSDRQKENHTIASQTEALIDYAQHDAPTLTWSSSADQLGRARLAACGI